MSISLFFNITGSPRLFDLPATFNYELSNERSMATRRSLAGNDIQQYSAKSEDAGIITYSQEIPTDTYFSVVAAHLEKAECFISDGRKTFEAVCDIPLGPAPHAGKCVLSATFRVIRRVA